MDRGVNEEGVLGRFSVSSQYDYTTDAAGRRTEIARSGTAMTEARADAYGYNARNELISAARQGGPGSVPADEYAYQYDDIGNRITSTDLGTNRTYTANFLNQYTLISNLCDSVTLCDDFVPQYDLDGNQTLVKTSTGVWQVSYNGENRPVSWTCGTTNIVMAYDRMGRRVLSRETVGGAVTDSNFSFVYDGYLCIQRLNATTRNVKLIFTWDPLEKVATRPLMVEKPGKYKMHVTHDGNKNVSELVFFSGGSGIAAHYEYAPFGAVTASTRSTSVTAYDFRTYNPFRFSSEYADDALGLVYYNYRHYNPLDGRWTSRDPIEEEGGINLMCFCHNAMTSIADSLGCGLLDYLPFISTVRNIIDSFIGHIPGESPTDYSVASPKDCKCNSLVAEAKCTARIQKEIISYSAQVLSSAVIARGVDFIVTTLMLNVNPFVAAAFFTDGIIGAYLNQRIYAKILEGAALAERNNCSCDQYGIH